MSIKTILSSYLSSPFSMGIVARIFWVSSILVLNWMFVFWAI